MLTSAVEPMLSTVFTRPIQMPVPRGEQEVAPTSPSQGSWIKIGNICNRGLPPGFTAKLEARLAETEAALFQVLSGRSSASQTTAWPVDTPTVPSSVSAGNQSKADRVQEWESLPLRSSADVHAWFRWKSAAVSPGSRRLSTTEQPVSQSSYAQEPEPEWPSEDVSVGSFSSPDQVRIVGSTSTRDTATPEQGSSRAKELSRSQRNIYF